MEKNCGFYRITYLPIVSLPTRRVKFVREKNVQLLCESLSESIYHVLRNCEMEYIIKEMR